MKIAGWDYQDGLHIKTAYDWDSIMQYYVNYKGNKGFLKAYVAPKKAHERYHYIMEYFKKVDYKPSMLDVGCGEGHTMKEFKKYGFAVSGIEYSEDHIKNAVVWGSVCKPEKLQSHLKFNLIIMGHSVEHQRDPIAYIKQYLKHLTPNGIMYIETPYVPSPDKISNEKLIKRLNLIYEHLFEFTPKALINTVESAGGEIVDVGRFDINHNTKYAKEIGYMLITAKPFTLNPFKLFKPCFILLWILIKAFFVGTVQKEIPLSSEYHGYSDFIRIIIKGKKEV